MAKRNKKKHQEEEAGEAWLLPYSDLMTLLLAVFIVLFAVSKVDEGKAEEMASSFREGMISQGGSGVMPGTGDSILPNPSGTDETQDPEGSDSSNSPKGQSEQDTLNNLQNELTSLFKEEGIDSSTTTYIDERGLIISMNNAILFDSGSAEIKPENENALIKIANTIDKLDSYIRIEGHTDNLPISNSIYPSNWELSSARAARVVRLFESCNIPSEKMVAVGCGEFKPVADNSTNEGRMRNRRIDIIILNAKYNDLEDPLSQVEKIE